MKATLFLTHTQIDIFVISCYLSRSVKSIPLTYSLESVSDAFNIYHSVPIAFTDAAKWTLPSEPVIQLSSPVKKLVCSDKWSCYLHLTLFCLVELITLCWKLSAVRNWFGLQRHLKRLFNTMWKPRYLIVIQHAARKGLWCGCVSLCTWQCTLKYRFEAWHCVNLFRE